MTILYKKILDTLQDHFPRSEIKLAVEHEGSNKYNLSISSSIFRGLERLEQHKLVYKALKKYLEDGQIHAITLETLEK
jgi:stress-induced morphogen